MSTSASIVLQPMQWASTRDIEEVEPLSDTDARLLSELREVLLRHEALDRFGITLIHKHFDLADDEHLVEFTDLENRRLTLTPVPKATVMSTIQTAWKFSKDPDAGRESMAECVSRCYYDQNSTPQHVNKHSIG